jgi:hypothetical protein
MRLGLLGPALDQEGALEEAARFLLQDVAVDRAVYLGIDGMLDRVVRRWAERVVGANPDDGALWSRAAARCIRASAEEIDGFLDAERERRSMKVLESLPGDQARAIEILNGKVAVMIWDKARLDEDDIAPAALLVFGKSAAPMVERVGSRWFLSPGPFPDAGTMLLEDHDDGIHVSLFDADGKEQRRELLLPGRGARVQVKG